MFSAILFLIAAEVAPQVVSGPLVEPDPKVMSQRQIHEFNANVPKDYPFHIRCVRSIETGSLVKTTYSCRTNRQWEAAFRQGNDNARETYEAVQGKFATGGE